MVTASECYPQAVQGEVCPGVHHALVGAGMLHGARPQQPHHHRPPTPNDVPVTKPATECSTTPSPGKA